MVLGCAKINNKVIINLAPADTKKEGSMYDLPIALGILVAQEIITNKQVSDYVILGELSLDGEIRKINGILPISATSFVCAGSSSLP